MEKKMNAYLVDPEWLQSKLRQPDIVVLDCTWFVPEAGKSGLEEFRLGHIPGARYVDLNEISDRNSPYVNMLPSSEQFASEVGKLGIDNNTRVIVYDSTYVSARVWWMFRLFGHQKVQILDGGLRRWKAEGRPLETGDPEPVEPVEFAAKEPADQVADWQEVLAAIRTGSAQIVDARTAERFTGEAPSGYPGVPGGHMPGAVNIPWSKMIAQSGDFRFATPEATEQLLRRQGVDATRPIISTCGSGVTAAILSFQLERMGRSNWRLYDGSWHEWGQRDDLPKESV
jgi:thiosulfate/3-mercaptopyruvate sulfurtransferase